MTTGAVLGSGPGRTAVLFATLWVVGGHACKREEATTGVLLRVDASNIPGKFSKITSLVISTEHDGNAGQPIQGSPISVPFGGTGDTRTVGILLREGNYLITVYAVGQGPGPVARGQVEGTVTAGPPTEVRVVLEGVSSSTTIKGDAGIADIENQSAMGGTRGIGGAPGMAGTSGSGLPPGDAGMSGSAGMGMTGAGGAPGSGGRQVPDAGRGDAPGSGGRQVPDAGGGGAGGAPGSGGRQVPDAGGAGGSVVGPSCAFVMPNPASAGLPNPAAYDTTQVGVVIDKVTGLIWERSGTGLTANFNQAEAAFYCSTLLVAGYSDWRLPTRLELLSLVDFTFESPAIDSVVFPGTPGTSTIAFWTSPVMSGLAWNVFFGKGSVNRNPVGIGNAVRCVR